MKDSENGYKNITFRLHAPEAQNVCIAGSFNDWNVSSHPLERCRERDNGDGYWQIPMRLLPGIYQYLFYVDGQWRNDPASNQYMANEFGTLDNVVEI